MNFPYKWMYVVASLLKVLNAPILFFMLYSTESRAEKSDAPTQMIVDFFIRKNTFDLHIFPCSNTEKYTWYEFVTDHEENFFISAHYGNIEVDHNCEFDKKLNIRTFYPQGFALNYDCACSKKLLRTIPSFLLGSEKYKWTIWSREKNWLEELNSYSLNMTLESDVTLFSLDLEVTKIIDAYKFQADWLINMTFAGTWTKERGFQWILNQPKSTRRKNMHGKQLSVGVVLPTFDTLDDPNLLSPYYKRDKDYYPRRDFQTWQILTDIYNFTNEFHITKIFGMQNSPTDPTFDGLVGLLQNSTVDIGFSLLRVGEREKVVNYIRTDINLPPFNVAFVFLHPKSFSRWRALYDSFPTPTWLSIITIFLVSTILLKIGIKFGENHAQPPSNATILILAVGAQQGLNLQKPTGISNRLLLLLTLLFAFMVNNFFNTALLTALLSTPPTTVNTLQELIDSEIPLSLENVTNNIAFFTETFNIQIMVKIYREKLKHPDGFLSLEDGLKKVRQGVLAFETNKRQLFYQTENQFSDTEKCSAKVIDAFPYRLSRALVIRKDLPYDEFISTGLLLLIERGITNYIDEFWNIKPPECMTRHYVPAHLNELLLAFFILIFGSIIAGTVLFFEIQTMSYILR